MKKKNKDIGKWVFFWSIIILILFVNFFCEFLEKQRIFEIIGHGIILLAVISFIFFSLKLKNKQAKKYILFGTILIFFIELIEILFHIIFSTTLLIEAYLSYNLFIEAIGILMLMKGFKEILK